MSLIRCPQCSNQISEEAENCPKCGFPISLTAKLKWTVQPIRHKKTLIESQSVYAWLLMVIGFVFLVAIPYQSAGGVVFRASGTALILVGVVWGFLIGLERWWTH